MHIKYFEVGSYCMMFLKSRSFLPSILIMFSFILCLCPMVAKWMLQLQSSQPHLECVERGEERGTALTYFPSVSLVKTVTYGHSSGQEMLRNCAQDFHDWLKLIHHLKVSIFSSRTKSDFLLARKKRISTVFVIPSIHICFRSQDGR